MGGIWEAAGKSMEIHFRRVVGNALLNEEEFRSALIQIEATFVFPNKSPLSEDPVLR